MRNFSQRFICIIKSKKFIFLKLMISDLIVSITVCLTIETDIEFEFAMRKTFSNFDLIEIKFELKLIANFSNLNDLKNLLNSIFDCVSRLTTTISCFIII